MNGTMLQGFSWYLPADGTHWRRIAEQAPSFAYEGVTSVWLPPAYKGQAGAQDVGYGVYDTYDLGEFDQKGTVRTKYGTREEYQDAIDALHYQGIDVLADVVLNQRMGADGVQDVRAQEVLGTDREKDVGSPLTIGAWTRFDFPGRGGAYSDFRWDWTCFHGVDWDERARRKGIFLFEGKHWDDAVERVEHAHHARRGAGEERGGAGVVPDRADAAHDQQGRDHALDGRVDAEGRHRAGDAAHHEQGAEDGRPDAGAADVCVPRADEVAHVVEVRVVTLHFFSSDTKVPRDRELVSGRRIPLICPKCHFYTLSFPPRAAATGPTQTLPGGIATPRDDRA